MENEPEKVRLKHGNAFEFAMNECDKSIKLLKTMIEDPKKWSMCLKERKLHERSEAAVLRTIELFVKKAQMEHNKTVKSFEEFKAETAKAEEEFKHLNVLLELNRKELAQLKKKSDSVERSPCCSKFNVEGERSVR